MNKYYQKKSTRTNLSTISKPMVPKETKKKKSPCSSHILTQKHTHQKFSFSSILNLSPVRNQPSTNVSLVAFALFQYPGLMFFPRNHSSPGSLKSASEPSSRTMRASKPGERTPVDSGIRWSLPPRAPVMGCMTAANVCYIYIYEILLTHTNSQKKKREREKVTHRFRHAVPYEKKETRTLESMTKYKKGEKKKN